MTISSIFLSAMLLIQAEEHQAQSGIIPRLSADTYEQAKACGRTGAECATAPYLLCPAENARYSVRLATPFSRVAASMLEGVKSGKPGRTMERGNANQWGTGIYVLPAEGSPSAAAIERVVVKRAGSMIQPLTATVGPIAVPMPDGSTKQLARGYFAFPAETFEPTADVSVVLTGSHGETTCQLSRTRLQAIR